MHWTTRLALIGAAVGLLVSLLTAGAGLAREWVQVRAAYQAGQEAGYRAGWQARERAPVCRALTEDSVIRGCDYHDRAWWIHR